LLHFGFDELFDLVNLEKAFGVFQLADDGAIRLSEDDNREFFAAKNFWPSDVLASATPMVTHCEA